MRPIHRINLVYTLTLMLMAGVLPSKALAKKSQLCQIQIESGLKALHKRVKFSKEVVNYFNQDKSLSLINKAIQEVELDGHLTTLKELGDEKADSMQLTKVYQNLALHIKEELEKIESHAHIIGVRGIDSNTYKPITMRIQDQSQNQYQYLHIGHVSELNVFWPKSMMSLIIRLRKNDTGVRPELVQLDLKEQSLVSIIGKGLVSKCKSKIKVAESKQPELIGGYFNIFSDSYQYSHQYSLYDSYPGYKKLLSLKNTDRCETLKFANEDKIQLTSRELATANLNSKDKALQKFDSQYFAKKFSDEVKKLDKKFKPEFEYPEIVESGFYLEGSIIKNGPKVRMDNQQWSLVLTNVVKEFVKGVRAEKNLKGLVGRVEIKSKMGKKVMSLSNLNTETLFEEQPTSVALIIELDKGDNLEVKLFQKSQGRGIAMESHTDNSNLKKLSLRAELKNKKELKAKCLNRD